MLCFTSLTTQDTAVSISWKVAQARLLSDTQSCLYQARVCIRKIFTGTKPAPPPPPPGEWAQGQPAATYIQARERLPRVESIMVSERTVNQASGE